jgi:hypothetical protein
MKCYPEHAAYLQGLGISGETAAKNDVVSMSSQTLEKLGIHGHDSGLSFNYPACPGTCRIRLFPASVGAGGAQEFWEPARPGTRFYVPAGVQPRLYNVGDPLVIVADEVAALAVSQVGVCVIGFAWPWDLRKWRLSQLRHTIPLEGRTVYLIPPHRMWDGSDPNALEQIETLVGEMDGLRACAQMLVITKGLSARGFRRDIAEHLAFAADAGTAWANLVRKAAPIWTIFPALAPAEASDGPDTIEELIQLRDRRPHIRPGQDYTDRLVIGVRVDKGIGFLSSRGDEWTRATIGSKYRIPTEVQLPEIFRPEAIARHLRGERVTLGDLVDRLEGLFREHIYWRHAEEPTVVALWAIGTYLFTAFTHYPYLWFHSAVSQSGKTTALELLSAVTFHATAVRVSTTPAVLYRDVGEGCRTLILDELNDLRKEKPALHGHVLRILNGGFRRGSVVTVMEWVDGVRQPVDYQVYTPKALAGLAHIPDALIGHCLKITMWPKSDTDPVTPIDVEAEKEPLAAIRDDLYRAALTHAEAMQAIYARREEFDLPTACDDRARDVLAPLFAIANFIDTHRQDSSRRMTSALQGFARDQAGIREFREEREELRQIIWALNRAPFNANGKAWLRPPEMRSLLIRKAGLNRDCSVTKIGRLLSGIGLHSASDRGRGPDPVRVYQFTKEDVAKLVQRFGESPPNA